MEAIGSDMSLFEKEVIQGGVDLELVVGLMTVLEPNVL